MISYEEQYFSLLNILETWKIYQNLQNKIDLFICGQKVQILSYIRCINSGKVMFSEATIINNTVIITLKVAKRISLNSSQHKKKW